MIRSYSVQSLFEVHVHFPSVSNPFYICSVFAISLHVTVYDFYSSLKSTHAGQHFACSRKKDSDSLTAPILTVLALVSHASLNHTLCLRAFFAPVLLTVVVLFTWSWLWLLNLRTIVLTDYKCRRICASMTYVCKTEWIRTDTSVCDPFSIPVMSIRYLFMVRSIVV